MSIEELTQPENQEPWWKAKYFPNGVPDFKWGQCNEQAIAEAPTEVKTGRKRGPQPDDEETIRKRDILVSVAVLGELEHYVGENVEPAKICTMKRDKLEVLFSAYEAKLGQEMTQDGMEAVVGSADKVINWFLPLDDVEALKTDLLENKQLRWSLGRHCASVAERYGDIVAFSKVLYDVVKHVNMDEPKNEEKKE